MSAASATSATARPGALEFLAAQPWFDPSAEPWPCGGDELFVGLVTFELAGDGLQRNAESRDVLLDFKAPLLASRTQSQFRLALRKARPRPVVGGKRSSGAAIDDDRLSPHGHAQAQGSCLFAHAATAGVALHGQLLHTQITRMTDNVQVLAGGSHAMSPMPFLRLQVSAPTPHHRTVTSGVCGHSAPEPDPNPKQFGGVALVRHACRKPLLIGRGRPRPGALRASPGGWSLQASAPRAACWP